MKAKLTHKFYAKAVGVGLFTATLLLMAADALGIAMCEVYRQGGYAVYERRLLTFVARLVSAEGALVALLVALIVAAVALFVFLMCAAGRREGREEPVLSRLDRVPFDFLALLSIFTCVGLFILLRDLLRSFSIYSFRAILLLPIGAILAVATLIGIMLCMTFASRVKSGTLFKNNIVAYVLVFLWRCAKAVGRGIRAMYSNLNVLWKAVLVYLALTALFILAVTDINRGRGLLFFLLFLLGFAAVCLVALQLRRLEKGGEALAAGDVGARVDTRRMLPALKKHARHLNGVAEGMDRAVEARMKSERMKTDLITNVSHDLKTPLTSVVNYVDLLQKEKIEGEAAREYLDALARQAQRLKKLTEDIVEASKASSGALGVALEPTDAGELLNQSMAEYAERFAAASLTPQVRVQEGLPRIMADGRLLWRVLDNLLGNAVKYSLPSTRVYCVAEQNGGAVLITVKNISREPLDMPVEELKERFARGDASRASEGNGLGLSIAQSLMELQKGTLTLAADGDLFKAELRLPVA
ncbi:MAG: HAMP domain-containing histidine kinase [Eubacteriales bacterium]|nr:HAMP domain-containing histidine kinase [Eubacteriales bacterium]